MQADFLQFLCGLTTKLSLRQKRRDDRIVAFGGQLERIVSGFVTHVSLILIAVWIYFFFQLMLNKILQQAHGWNYAI